MERSMFGISLRDKIRNTEIRGSTNVKDIIERVAELTWRWVGVLGDHKKDDSTT